MEDCRGEGREAVIVGRRGARTLRVATGRQTKAEACGLQVLTGDGRIDLGVRVRRLLRRVLAVRWCANVANPIAQQASS